MLFLTCTSLSELQHSAQSASPQAKQIFTKRSQHIVPFASTQIFTKRVKEGVWDITAIVDSGGMPSSHSALVMVGHCMQRPVHAQSCPALHRLPLLQSSATVTVTSSPSALISLCPGTGGHHRGGAQAGRGQLHLCCVTRLQPGRHVRRSQRAVARRQALKGALNMRTAPLLQQLLLLMSGCAC